MGRGPAMARTTSHLLRTTEEAEAWIGQFKDGDRARAASLIESLILVSHSEFQNGLFALIRHARGGAKRPIPLFAAREADEEEEDVDVHEDGVTSPSANWAATSARTLPYFDP